MELKKYSRSLDLLLAATQAYRRGNIAMSGRWFTRAMVANGIEQTVASLDEMNEKLMLRSPTMAKAIETARKELAKVKVKGKRKIVKADDVLDEEEIPDGTDPEFGDGLEETIEGEETTDPNQEIVEPVEGETPDMDEDLEAMLDDTGDEDDVEEDSASGTEEEFKEEEDELEKEDEEEAKDNTFIEEKKEEKENEAKVLSSKKKAAASTKAIAIAKANKRKIRSQARVTRAAKNLKALARLSKGKK
jgi:hypothetical protein